MCAVRIADGHVRADGAGNPLRPGQQCENQANPAQVRPDAQGPRLVRIWNPDIDLDVMIQTICEGNQLDPLRQITQQPRIQYGWITHSYHSEPCHYATR